MPVPYHLKEIISNLPESSGIYKFLDKKGNLLYIGKSKNLKKRVTRYFRKQSEETHERTLRLIFHIYQIEIIKTKTELEALILEDNLIKKFLPAYNIKQKQFNKQVYITVTTDEYPVVKIIESKEIELFCTFFGPFKDKYAAENLLVILREILLVRTCTDPIPTKKCINYSIGKCSGPCKGEISIIEYQEIIDIAIKFLQGYSESIIEIINMRITKVASELQFEDAAKLRDLRNYCKNFGKRQRFISNFKKKNLVIKSRYIDQTFLFQSGRLIKVYKWNPSGKMIKSCFQKKQNTNIQNPHLLMDRAYVVWVWMKRNEGKAEIY